MARAFGVFCCFVVGLQLLVGIPLIVCVAFFAIQGGLGPIALEVHTGPVHSPQMLIHGPTIPPPPASSPIPLTLSPPPNVIPPVPPAAPSPPAAPENPILQTRAEQGSPLDGTILTQNSPPAVERDLFVAALEKVAAEATNEAAAPQTRSAAACPAAEPPCCAASAECDQLTETRAEVDCVVLQRLYEIAEIDERAGNYERADQWRALARDIRRAQTSSQPRASELEGAPATGPALVSP